MHPLAWLILPAAGGVTAYLLIQRHRTAARDRLRNQPPPDQWISILKQTLPVVERLSGPLKQQLFGTMQIFLAEKSFEGCGGQEITEEIRVTVAAQACMLLLGRNAPVYPKLKTILIYPHTYQGGGKGMFGGDNGASARLGESWDCGVVILSWDSVRGGARNFEDGHNVTLHEFAHQLDQADGAADGAPILEARSAYATWARVFSEEYQQLVSKTRHGRKSTMDRYGATNPAEFFAVATETFFEKPKQMQQKHPELFEELKSYYRVDPTNWI